MKCSGESEPVVCAANSQKILTSASMLQLSENKRFMYDDNNRGTGLKAGAKCPRNFRPRQPLPYQAAKLGPGNHVAERIGG